MLRVFVVLSLLLSSAPAVSQSLERVSSVEGFVETVEGRELTRLGIKLTVSPSGDIRGHAFGKPVVGTWRWQDGYFCRDLYFGDENLGPNCQLVSAHKDTIRFTSDRGAGQSAGFKLR
ncbi:hypothetical protein EDD53_2642 [Pacificibacter maritimus]|uniref:Dihydrodipicolinate reductase n=1 Tax=Pacificibacter maritimus TaxID=762213 RepID=A0A3N4UID0_9RHOB|nr:dihydrodipicolinate reductase [Pacificibacter maritimus]RPE64877.1 hypothetical protein EDD53_2642 [Pacificibacter maritimus]